MSRGGCPGKQKIEFGSKIHVHLTLAPRKTNKET